LRLRPRIGVLELHRGAEDDPLAGQLGDVDDLGSRQPILEHEDAALEVALALLGGMVLGVFAQITVLAGHADVVDVLGPLDRLEVLQLALDRLGALPGHGDLVRRH